jgi:hypothetical protein
MEGEFVMREWFCVSELAGLPSLPATVQNIRTRAAREGWESRKRATGKGMEYHFRSLPKVTQAALLKRELKDAAITGETPLSEPKTPSSGRGSAPYTYSPESLWAAFDRKTAAQKQKGKQKADFFHLVMKLTEGENSLNFVEALELVAAEQGISPATARGWWYGTTGKVGLVNYHPADWMAAGVSGHIGRTATAEMSEDAWEMFKADYLRLEKPASMACYQRVMAAAVSHGWVVPTEITFRRRVEREIPLTVRTLLREGEHALMRMYPAQVRTKADMHALYWINGDGYEHNVFVKWPDGTIARPKTWFWHDVYSNMFLSYRVDQTEHTDQLILSFGDVVERFGIPEHVTIDNTRAAANKYLTGGVANRYRFKVKEDDPLGLLPTLGCQVHWTSVLNGRGHGQAKPVERAFGWGGISEYCDKHPAFAGAYTGHNTTAKPENYGSKAIPLEQFLEVLEQAVRTINTREGRRTEVCGGLLSFEQAFEQSYANAVIRKATAEQRRLWLLSTEGVRVNHEACIQLEAGAGVGFGKNRYYAEALYRFVGQKVLARFDPQALHDRVYVYTLDNQFIAEAPCQAATGFGDTQAAREHTRSRKHMMNATKAKAQAEKKMSALEAAARLPKLEEPSAPEAKVVKGIFPTAGNLALQSGDEEGQGEHDNSFSKAVAMLRQAKKPIL